MHRHARPGALLIFFVLVLLAGAVTFAGPATALTSPVSGAVGMANVTPHPDDDVVALAAAPATRHLTAPTLFGLLTEATRPPTAASASCGADSRHDRPVTQEIGTRQDRAPPAITDR
ncbi:MAG: hypothetical protein ACRDSG_17845 [Pseudonocardiaceae bacterium]